MIHLNIYRKYGTAHGKINDLLDGMLLGQEDGTLMGSAVILVDGEVYM